MRVTPANALLYALSLGVAAYAFVGYGVMPIGSLAHPDMRADFVAHPTGLQVHVFGATVALLALGWLYTGWRAFVAIRRGAIVEHRRWMVRNFALSFAAIMLRLYIPASVAIGADFGTAYPASPGSAGCRTWWSRSGDSTARGAARSRRKGRAPVPHLISPGYFDIMPAENWSKPWPQSSCATFPRRPSGR